MGYVNVGIARATKNMLKRVVRFGIIEAGMRDLMIDSGGREYIK